MENKIEELIKCFYGKDVINTKKARYELVKMGNPAIEYLIPLIDDPKMHVRWEAIKTLSQIATPETIPILIKALENDDFDVRWIAAEGLIDIGKKSIQPLLKSLVADQDSKFLLEGAHHVFKELHFKKLFENDEIIKILEDYRRHPEVAVEAERLLGKYEAF